MPDAQITLKTLAHLQQDGVCFTIAGYQRGFRWTRAEVRDLLDYRQLLHTQWGRCIRRLVREEA